MLSSLLCQIYISEKVYPNNNIAKNRLILKTLVTYKFGTKVIKDDIGLYFSPFSCDINYNIKKAEAL